ncbi:hypothetical protein [Rhodobacter ferrooxidans]|uniref:hypothetical protein n=1 Tax=Rhodobacter ferrooxidans TaxID=371731 RepID=UPI0005942DDD|nr:hypothetical protein [Rhodobacter sp. SW2]
MAVLARVFRKPSLQQEDRLPVSTYDEAVRRLVQIRLDDTVTDEAYSLAVNLVADIFWVADKRLRRDVAVAARQLGGV